jgi:hypothetical protein
MGVRLPDTSGNLHSVRPVQSNDSATPPSLDPGLRMDPGLQGKRNSRLAAARYGPSHAQQEVRPIIYNHLPPGFQDLPDRDSRQGIDAGKPAVRLRAVFFL